MFEHCANMAVYRTGKAAKFLLCHHVIRLTAVWKRHSFSQFVFGVLLHLHWEVKREAVQLMYAWFIALHYHEAALLHVTLWHSYLCVLGT